MGRRTARLLSCNTLWPTYTRSAYKNIKHKTYEYTRPCTRDFCDFICHTPKNLKTSAKHINIIANDHPGVAALSSFRARPLWRAPHGCRHSREIAGLTYARTRNTDNKIHYNQMVICGNE